jgi:hypothetical protein
MGFPQQKSAPSPHNCTASIKAVSAPVSSLYRSPDLMAQRFFDEIACKTGIFSPRPKCGSQSVWRDRATALGIDPTSPNSPEFLSFSWPCCSPGLEAREYKLSKSRSAHSNCAVITSFSWCVLYIICRCDHGEWHAEGLKTATTTSDLIGFRRSQALPPSR